jgi:hypothetical protein
MPLNRGTQKQIAQRFQGNLDYFRKGHYWRRLRFVTILVGSLLGAVAIACFFSSKSESKYNPGPISQHHALIEVRCDECHGPLNKDLKNLTAANLKLTNQGIDGHCQDCHGGHSFHETNVMHEASCTVCHQEHKGHGPMAAPNDFQCGRCHNNTKEMIASANKGVKMDPAAFEKWPDMGRKIFKAPRPSEGFTAVFASFTDGHPDFRVRSSSELRETNTLKFNHYRHLVLTDDIPPVKKNQRLTCEFCHEPAPGGAFMRPVSYERHCRDCHSLQFDVGQTNLTLPHGRVEHTRAFLRSLPLEYADIAQRGGTNEEQQVRKFVSDQMKRLKDQFTDGTNLESLVFNTGTNLPDLVALTIRPDSDRNLFLTRLREAPGERAKFDGCSTCHEVLPKPFEVPAFVRPWQPDRWMIRARFDHSKHLSFDHTNLLCISCHGAALKPETGKETANILMPSKDACTDCHSPKGKIASNCSFCHSYHLPTARAMTVTSNVSRGRKEKPRL